MKQKTIASWVFGGISFVFLIAVFFFAPKELPEQNHRILGLMAAFAAGFLGFFMGGTLGIDGSARFKPFGKFAIKAGGGLALFIVVLFWWNSDKSPTKVGQALRSIDTNVASLSERVADSTRTLLAAIESKEKGVSARPSPAVLEQARLVLEHGDKKQRAIAEIALRHTNAAQALLTELAEDPVNEVVEILNLKGDNWFFAGLADQSIAPYEQVLALRPNDPAALMNLGGAHTWAHQGDKAAHIETAIRLLTTASDLAQQKGNLVQWAGAQHLLGDAWGDRSLGSPAENIAAAIAAYEQALTVRTKDAYPIPWARTQANLAACLTGLPSSAPAETMRKAIALSEEAKEVFTKAEHPFEHAALQTIQADAWSELPEGNREENTLKAISLYEEALSVRTKAVDAAEWALIQNNLAGAWSYFKQGDRVQNLHKAIDGYEAAMTVYTEAAYPADWARTNYNLAIVHSLLAGLAGQPKRELLRKAVDLQRRALTIWTEAGFPNDHSMAQAELAQAETALNELDATARVARP